MLDIVLVLLFFKITRAIFLSLSTSHKESIKNGQLSDDVVRNIDILPHFAGFAVLNFCVDRIFKKLEPGKKYDNHISNLKKQKKQQHIFENDMLL